MKLKCFALFILVNLLVVPAFALSMSPLQSDTDIHYTLDPVKDWDIKLGPGEKFGWAKGTPVKWNRYAEADLEAARNPDGTKMFRNNFEMAKVNAPRQNWQEEQLIAGNYVEVQPSYPVVGPLGYEPRYNAATGRTDWSFTLPNGKPRMTFSPRLDPEICFPNPVRTYLIYDRAGQPRIREIYWGAFYKKCGNPWGQFVPVVKDRIAYTVKDTVTQTEKVNFAFYIDNPAPVINRLIQPTITSTAPQQLVYFPVGAQKPEQMGSYIEQLDSGFCVNVVPQVKINVSQWQYQQQQQWQSQSNGGPPPVINLPPPSTPHPTNPEAPNEQEHDGSMNPTGGGGGVHNANGGH